MSSKLRIPRGSWITSFGGRKELDKPRYRIARFEELEHRQLLAVLNPISGGTLPDVNVTVAAGAPLNIALDIANVTGFNVLNSNASMATGTVYDASHNRSLQLTVHSADNTINGVMTFELFEQLAPDTTGRIIDLVNTEINPVTNGPFYVGTTFHRVIKDFMIQGGDPQGTGSGGSGVQIDDEFNALLQHTSAGILSMAKSQDDTNDSQFFITSGPTRWLDFQHTIFGLLTSGDAIREQIENVTVDSNDKPLSAVTITGAQIVTDNNHAVLQLAAPANAASGTTDITVTAWTQVPNGDNVEYKQITQTYHVTIVPDTTNNNPFLGTIASVETTANTPIGLNIPASDIEGDAIYYWAGADSGSTHITVTVNNSTGAVTVTPKDNFAGVQTVNVAVRAVTDNGSNWDMQQVPVYIKPATPTVQLATSSDTGANTGDGITKLNQGISFRVSGTAVGAMVYVYVDGVEVGSKQATTDSEIVPLRAGVTLTDGAHSITAKQILQNQTVDVGNLQTTKTLESATSAATSITIDTLPPAITSTDVTQTIEGQPYVNDVETTEESTPGAVSYRLGTGSPAGMLINAQTGVITWTPPVPGTQPITYIVEDKAGNLVQRTFNLAVQAVNSKPTAITPANPYVVANDSVLTIKLTGNDNDAEKVQVLTYKIVGSGPQHGTLSGVDSAGVVTGDTVTYTPDATYVASFPAYTDSFRFTVTDDDQAGEPFNLTSDEAVISINVVNVNHKPTANPIASVATSEDTPIAIVLTGDDGDPEFEQVLQYVIVQQPAHGTLTTPDSAGHVTYVPSANYNGTDSFQFAVIDDALAGDPAALHSDPATVTINIAAVNDLPTGASQTVSVNQNASKLIQLFGDDGDPELTQAITFSIVSQPSHGTLTGFNPTSGALTYVPSATFSGTDTFSYKVAEDGPDGLVSTVKTVTINVAAVNSSPVANAQTVTGDEDTQIVFTLTGDDGDPEVQQTLRFNLVQGPASGKVLAFDPATGRVVYQPGPDFNGTDQIRFSVTDDDKAGDPKSLTSATAVVTINVTPVDDAPRFSPTGSFTVIQGQTLSLQVQAQDPDHASTIVYSVEPAAPDGLVLDKATGAIRWTVPTTFPSGAFVLTIRATEMTGGQPGLSSTQNVAINIINLAAVLSASSGFGSSGPLVTPQLEAAINFLAEQASQQTISNAAAVAPGYISVTGNSALLGPEIDMSSGAGRGAEATVEAEPSQPLKAAQPPKQESEAPPAGRSNADSNKNAAEEQRRTTATDQAVEDFEAVAYAEEYDAAEDLAAVPAAAGSEYQASDMALQEFADEAFVGEAAIVEESFAM